MPLGVDIDFNANIARFGNQIDRLSGNLDRFQQRAETMAGRVNRVFGSLGVGLSVNASTISITENHHSLL